MDLVDLYSLLQPTPTGEPGRFTLDINRARITVEGHHSEADWGASFQSPPTRSGPVAPAVLDAALELFRSGSSTLLFDLAGTRIINSIGVSILLEVLEEVLDRDGKMAFCTLSPTIAKTFEIMGLSHYAVIYPDRSEALAALAPHEH